VVLENFVPGKLDKLGIGYEGLRKHNPRIIYASGSGYGRSGPYREYPAMDITIQAMAGVMSVTGFPDGPPTKAGPAMCDFSGGVHLYGAVTTALYEREKTGEGQLVEVAMFEAVYASLASSLGLYFGSGSYGSPITSPQRTGNAHSGGAAAPYTTYQTTDGYVAILCTNNTHWKSLVKAMDRPELDVDERFDTPKKRAHNVNAVDEIVGVFAATFTRRELCSLLLQHRVPCAPVQDLAEVTNDPHLHERGMLEWIQHPQYGRIAATRSPLRFSNAPRTPLTPSAELGAHNRQIYCDWLGLSQAEFEELEKQEVI
jgi:formyl-CoA transferase